VEGTGLKFKNEMVNFKR